MELTQIRQGANSRAQPLAIAGSASFAASQVASSGQPVGVWIEDMLTMRPKRRAFMSGTTACVVNSVSRTWMAMERANISGVTSSIRQRLEPMPTLLTRMSTPSISLSIRPHRLDVADVGAIGAGAAPRLADEPGRIGVSTPVMIWRHVLPNCLPPALVGSPR